MRKSSSMAVARERGAGSGERGRGSMSTVRVLRRCVGEVGDGVELEDGQVAMREVV